MTTAVWDPLIRLFHWSLVGTGLIAYFTQEENYPLHLSSGYAVLGLISFRVLWGFVGPRHARFTYFVTSPRIVSGYLRDLYKGRALRYLGHNPAGGAMVLAMLVTLFVLTLSGIALDAAENRAGPLAGMRLFHYTDSIALVHEIATHVVCVLVALHLAGVAVSSRLHRENLVVAMLSGRKRVEP